MKKLLLTTIAVGTLGVAGTAVGAPLVAVSDPTPDGVFTGTYQTGTDEDGNATYGSQQGYVGVYEDGIVACNGNEQITRPDDGSPLQGYIWIGSGQAASNPTAADPSNNLGAGNNNEDADGNPTGDSPCPDGDPEGVNE